nr:COX2 [Donax vittatus]
MMNSLKWNNIFDSNMSMEWGCQEGLNLIILHDAYVLMSFSVMTLILSSLILYVPKKMMMITTCLDRKKVSNNNNPLEFFWTISAILVLALISYYSLMTLYSSKFLMNNSDCISVKIIGHQWYWEYEYVVNIHKALKAVGSSGMAVFISDYSGLLDLKEAASKSMTTDVVLGSMVFTELFMWSPSNWENFMGMGSGGSGDDDPNKNRNNQNQGAWFSNDVDTSDNSNKNETSGGDENKSSEASGFSNSGWGTSNPEGSFVPESSNNTSPNNNNPPQNPEGWFVPEPSTSAGESLNPFEAPVAPREVEGMVHEVSEPDPGMDMNNNQYGSQNRNLGYRN